MEQGIPIHTIPRCRFKPRRLLTLRRLVRRECARIVVSWSSHVAIYARWLCFAGRPARVFNLRQDLLVDARTGNPRTSLRWYRGALEAADIVVSNSNHSLLALAGRGIRFRASEVIRNMVPAAGRGSPKVSVAATRIVAVGSLKPLKAYDVLLQALAILAKQGKTFELLLAGDGPERASLESLARELAIEDRVTFLGPVDDVPGLIAGAQIVAHPSKSEGLSNTILEAMAEGVPVVATAVGAAPEIIEDGRSGLLVPPGCPESLAASLGRLIDDPDLRDRLGREGLRYVRRECDESQVADGYERLFRRLLPRLEKT